MRTRCIKEGQGNYDYKATAVRDPPTWCTLIQSYFFNFPQKQLHIQEVILLATSEAFLRIKIVPRLFYR